jgi:uncharacterized membrane protein (UPF0127 family)
MKKKIIIHYKKKRITVIAEDCNSLRKFIGLMFSRRQKAGILMFKFKKKRKIVIHSFFVFYSFVAVWLDERNRVMDLKVVKSFIPYVSHKNKADKLIEIPINKKYDDILTLLVGD